MLMLKCFLAIAGLLAGIIGLHGLFVYCSFPEKIDLLFGEKDPRDLFLAISIPWAPVGDCIEWMTDRAFWSWIPPVVSVVLGMWVWGMGSAIELSYWTKRRLKQWMSIALPLCIGIVLLLIWTPWLGGTSSKTLPGDQVRTIGSWKFVLDSGKWNGNDLEIDLTIINIGNESRIWDAGGVGISYPEILCVDRYGESFVSVVGNWYGYEKFSPGEGRSGPLRFKLSEFSGDVSLGLGSHLPLFKPRVVEVLFDLGSFSEGDRK